MPHRIGQDALVDVGRCLNRFDVDAIQWASWKSHVHLADMTHVLPVRLLDKAKIHGGRVSVSARDATRGSVNFDGTSKEAFLLGFTAIRDSDLKWLILPAAGVPESDEERERIAAIASTVKISNLNFCGNVEFLSTHWLMFGFAYVENLRLDLFNGAHLTDEHLHECGRRKIEDLCVVVANAEPLAVSDEGNAEPLAVSDEGVLDYLFAPENGMATRRLHLSAFNTSPQFVQKLVKRAQQAMDAGCIVLHVHHLPLRSQQLDGLHLTQYDDDNYYYQEYLENGRYLTFTFDSAFSFNN